VPWGDDVGQLHVGRRGRSGPTSAQPLSAYYRAFDGLTRSAIFAVCPVNGIDGRRVGACVRRCRPISVDGQSNLRDEALSYAAISPSSRDEMLYRHHRRSAALAPWPCPARVTCEPCFERRRASSQASNLAEKRDRKTRGCVRNCIARLGRCRSPYALTRRHRLRMR